jgi:dienelactone hydrolase
MEDESISIKLKDAKPAATQVQRSRMRNVGVGMARVLLIAMCGISFFLSVLPWGRAFVRSTLLLPALIDASEPAVLTFFGEPIRFRRTTLSGSQGPIFLDIYEPTNAPPPIPGKRAALINIAGVGDNRNSPQLVNFSRAFAREGLVVVNVGTPTLFNFVVATQDSEAVVQTFDFLAHYPGVDPARIGIVGFSAGGTLACLAATDPRIRDRLAFVTLFGSYFDVTSLLYDLGRRALVVNGKMQPWQPTYVPTQVLALSMSSTLSLDENQLFQQTFTQNGRPLDSAELAQLSPPAAAIYHLLIGDEPGRVAQNVAALSPAMKTLLAQLSPSTMIAHIHAPIYVLHSRDDQYVPFTQSVSFAAALAHIHHPYDFVEFGIFSHVEVQPGAALSQEAADGVQMLRILNKMLLSAS